jgi:hypothetical protein
MKNQTETMTAQQSLDIIAGMIAQAKGNARRNNFFYLFWGWVVVVANIGMFALTKMHYAQPYAVWLITLPAWIFTLYKAFKDGKKEKTVSHFARISSSLWICFGVSIFTLVFFGFKINYELNPVILIVSAIPTIVSGVILNFRPFMIGGVVFWITGIICFLVTREVQPLIGALAVFCGYLIPGYMLKQKTD